MFKSKTLFIVGAGASSEVGLPSGLVLKTQIASLLDIKYEHFNDLISGDEQIAYCLRQAGAFLGNNAPANAFLEKAWRLVTALPAARSIDNFLDAHQGDKMIELCGKLGIVKSILAAEGESKLFNIDEYDRQQRIDLSAISDTWYVQFLQMLTENLPKSDVASAFENVSFITFNYDRCIEFFLAQALENYYDISAHEAETIVSKVSIFHPYGQVGFLPWQNRGQGIPYGTIKTNLLDLTKQIKTFTERFDDETVMKSMHAAVTDAETIVFLGFAFHPTNMKLLKPPQACKTKRIFATTYGLSVADEQVIENDIVEMIGASKNKRMRSQKLQMNYNSLKCGEFFYEYFRSMSASVF